MIDKNKTKKIKLGFSDAAFDTIIVVLIGIFLLLVLYPLIYIVSSSFSSGEAVTTGKVLLWPVDFSLRGYEIVFSYSSVWTGYLNTIFYTVVGTLIKVVITIIAAYPMSRKNFQGRKVLNYFYMIPMFFGGGLIPTYILVSNLHLVNTRAVLLIIGAFGLTDMVIMRTFFQSNIPNELLESAKMDGASNWTIFIKVILPQVTPCLAAIAITQATGVWNDYSTPMIYMRDYPNLAYGMYLFKYSSFLVKDSMPIYFAAAVISCLPVIILYTCSQNLILNNMTTGGLKG